MDYKYLSIGQMAKINNISIPTLRFYDSIRILQPCYTDPQTHYRYYDVKQNARLDMIQYMEELGMELKEIGEVLASEDLYKIKEILIRKREQTIRQIEQMKIQRYGIERAIDSIERYSKSPRCGTFTLEYIPSRKIYGIDTDINFYAYDIDAYELILKQLKMKLTDHGIPTVYYCNAGTMLKKDDFLQKNFVSDKIFVFVDEHFPLKQELETIENGMYACVYLDDFNEEKDYAVKLLSYCAEHDYEISGDYICETLTEFNVFDTQKRSMFLRLQVPVKFASSQLV